MILARVKGTVVSSQKTPEMGGIKLLLLEKVDPETLEGKNDFVVAMDSVGAGTDEMVMIAQSTSARETPVTKNKAIDAIIVGIIDKIDEEDKVVYKK